MHLATVSHSTDRRLPPPIGTRRGGAPANRRGGAGRGSTCLLEFSPRAVAGEALSIARAPAAVSGGILITMGTEARTGRRELLLFTSVILCKFPEFREESVGRVRGWREALPTPLARGRGGVEKPTSLTLLVPLSTPGPPVSPPPHPAVAGSPPPHLFPFAPTGREPRLPQVAKNKGGGSPTFPGLIYWRGLCTHPPRRTPPHAPGKAILPSSTHPTSAHNPREA